MHYCLTDVLSKEITRASYVIILGVLHWITGPAAAELILFEEFADGDPFDANPASWVGGGGDSLSVDETGLLMESDDFGRAGVQELGLTDISVRTRVSVIEGGMVGIASRWQPGGPNGSSYYGVTGSGSTLLGIGSTMAILASGGVRNVNLSDVMLQLDVIGDQIDFWIWKPSEMMPEEPNLSTHHTDITDGDFYIFAGGSYDFDPRGPVKVAIRYVEVADRHIATGDFDSNGQLDIDDLNSLSAAINGNAHSLRYDVNDNEAVDQQDHKFWVKELRRTYFGDANLDGEFNSLDLTEVLQAGKYGLNVEASWAHGDWTGDGRFDRNDILLALQDGGYGQGRLAAVTPIPEPSCVMLLLIGAIGVLRVMRLR